MTDATLSTDFAGRRGRLFRLAAVSGLLTVVTLGFYRFWMKTRLRRYYWSSVRPGGLPLEYAGEPVEKLLGFLVAVTILAFYIGAVNLVLMYASFAVLHGNVAAYVVSAVGVVPLFFYARYRARRYVVARTRWRGIRFGMEGGAWGYAFRAMGHVLLTVVTFGLLWPRMTFKLEKYLTDRTSFGTATLRQGGSWRMLVPAVAPLWAMLFCLGAVIGMMLAYDTYQAWPIAAVLAVLTVYATVHWRVDSWRRLTEAKGGGGLGFRAAPRPGRVLRIYLTGAALILAVLLLIFTGFALVLASALDGTLDLTSGGGASLMSLPAWVSAALGAALYLLFFLAWGVLRHVFLTLPIWRHYAETLEITGAEALPGIRQRAGDELPEAEGFAEALDVGSAL